MPAPTLERPPGPPDPRLTRREWRAALEVVRLLARSRRLRNLPRGDGRLTVDIPGYLAPEASMAPLRWFLRRQGYTTRSWGLGTNRGNPESLRHRFVAALEPMVEAAGQPANLVAWSLGGVVAREAARLRPDLVHRIVCYGSPLIGGPKYTWAAARIGVEVCDRIEQVQADLDRDSPLQVPITSIFSRLDGVVDWRAWMDHSPLADHHEVSSTHFGLGLDPDVWEAVTRALARQA